METFRFPFVVRLRIRLEFTFKFCFKWMRSEWVSVGASASSSTRISCNTSIFMLDRFLYNIFSYLHWLKYDRRPHSITSPTCSPISLLLSLSLCVFVLRQNSFYCLHSNDSQTMLESSRNLIRFSTCSNGETINKALDKCPSTPSLSLFPVFVFLFLSLDTRLFSNCFRSQRRLKTNG